MKMRHHAQIALVYFVLHALLSLVSTRSGVFMTSRSSLADLCALILALTVTVLRLYAVFVLPAVCVHFALTRGFRDKRLARIVANTDGG